MQVGLAAIAIGVLTTLITALCLVGWLTRGLDDPRRTIGWAASHGIAITAQTRPLVSWWVRLSGTLRVVGGVSGLVLGSLFDDAFGLNTSAGPGFWVWITLGWIAGGTWAWEVVTRETDDGSATASLVPRAVADYVPVAARWGPALAAAVTVAIAGSSRWLGPITDPQGFPVGSPAERLLLGGGAVLLAIVARLLVNRVVARRQATTDPQVVAIDDAIRATTTHLVAGGATAAILLLGLQAAQSVLQPRQVPFGLRFWIPLAFAVSAWFSGRYLANRPWKVHRTVAP